VTVPLWVLPVLLLLPFPVGVLAGYLTAGLLELREVAAIARAHPAGTPPPSWTPRPPRSTTPPPTAP
jgi:hypothetical protein